MFNIFKKNQDSIRENLGDFQDSFTLEQKAVIIYALIFVAKSDGHIHPNEMHVIKQTTRILGFVNK